jgi:hypothetical protein
MNWKEYGRKLSQANFRHYPGIFLEGLKKTMKYLRIVGLKNLPDWK